MTLAQIRLFMDGCAKVNTNDMIQGIDATSLAIAVTMASEKDQLKIRRSIDKMRNS